MGLQAMVLDLHHVLGILPHPGDCDGSMMKETLESVKKLEDQIKQLLFARALVRRQTLTTWWCSLTRSAPCGSRRSS
ncbi:hypothetical protein BRADI_2g17883v3 [Brachypodium distachyon]|uniref:Uncharacterized protein n=1 Tax=Brachypodium distachyon TaxID=15368 RepID=A0A2K2D939_BRADI|nr:hypothetical protein BRADI_2g17883v3 [Brachypodium distachyon]